jgi:tetraprenyl-beta-curcumene synthase
MNRVMAARPRTVTSPELPLAAQLVSAGTRELLWGLRAGSVIRHSWELRARRIPNEMIRQQALESLKAKRGHTDGAGLFTILPRTRCPALLRALITYEIILEFLDDISEHLVEQADVGQLHRALIEALDPESEISDYYASCPRMDDGGYLETLVQSCRMACVSLVSHDRVKSWLLYHAAANAEVQTLNHLAGCEQRDQALRAWAWKSQDQKPCLQWWELTAAASSSLAIHLLLALAADGDWESPAAALAAYVPWVCAASTLLDSYVDQADDAARHDHSYLTHYRSRVVASRRLSWLICTAMIKARSLPNGHRHAIIVASMVAMYLSKSSALAPGARSTTVSLLSSAGPLAIMLLPVLWLWRSSVSLRDV